MIAKVSGCVLWRCHLLAVFACVIAEEHHGTEDCFLSQELRENGQHFTRVTPFPCSSCTHLHIGGVEIYTPDRLYRPQRFREIPITNSISSIKEDINCGGGEMHTDPVIAVSALSTSTIVASTGQQNTSHGASNTSGAPDNSTDINDLQSVTPRDSHHGSGTLDITMLPVSADATQTSNNEATTSTVTDDGMLPDCSTKPDGTFFKHLLDCNKYYQCSNGVPYLIGCFTGLYWDSHMRRCGYECI